MTRRSRHPDPMLAPPVIEALLEAQTPGLPPPERMRALRQRVLDSVVAEQRVDTAGHLTIRGVEGIWIPLLPGISLKLPARAVTYCAWLRDRRFRRTTISTKRNAWCWKGKSALAMSMRKPAIIIWRAVAFPMAAFRP